MVSNTVKGALMRLSVVLGEMSLEELQELIQALCEVTGPHEAVALRAANVIQCFIDEHYL